MRIKKRVVLVIGFLICFFLVAKSAPIVVYAEDNPTDILEKSRKELDKEQEKQKERTKKPEKTAPKEPKVLEDTKKAISEEQETRENGEFYEKVEEKQGGITLKGKEYPLATYKGHSTGGKIEEGIIALGNGIFWLTKLVYSGVDEGLNLIASQELIKDNAKLVSGVARTLWDELSSVYGVILIAIAGMIAFFLMAIRGDVANGVQTIVKVIFVFVIGSLFLAKADTVIDTLDNVSAELQGTVLKVGKVFQEDYKEIPEGQERDGTVGILRNVWFDITVYRPYLVMNYGTVDTQAINKDDSERIESLLKVKKNEKSKKALEKIITAEAEKEDNSFMDGEGDGVFSKLGISIFSLIVVISLGIPFLTLALANLIIQFAVLGIILILPFSLLMSLLPSYGNSAYKLIGKLVVAFLAKGMVALFVLFIVLAVTIVDASVSLSRTQADIPLNNPIGRYILHTLTLVIILNVLISQRNKILSLITGGKVQISNHEATARRGMGGMMMSGALLSGMTRRLGNKGKQGLNKLNNSEPVRKRRTQISSVARKSMSRMRNNFSPKRQLNPQTGGTGGGNVIPFNRSQRSTSGNSGKQGTSPKREIRTRPKSNPNPLSKKRQLKTRQKNNTGGTGSKLSTKRQLRTSNRRQRPRVANKYSQKRNLIVPKTSVKRLNNRFKAFDNKKGINIYRRPKKAQNEK